MDVKIVIDDGLIKQLKRIFSKTTLVIVALCIGIGSTTYVYATSSTPTNTFVPNTVISSSEVNQNFDDLYEGVNALEQKHSAGVVSMYAGSIAPSGYLICDGSEVSRTTYASLFAAIGTSYGAGNGSSTFDLPDLQGRVAVGLDTSQPGFDSLDAFGGELTHSLTTAELPSHAHSGSTSAVTDHSHTGTAAAAGAHSHSVSLAGAQSSGTTSTPSGNNIPFARNLAAGVHNDGAFDEMLLWNGGAFIQPPDWDFMPRVNAANVTSGAVTSHSHGITIGAAGGHSHSFTTSSIGGGTAHNVVQPYVVMNYIIAY